MRRKRGRLRGGVAHGDQTALDNVGFWQWSGEDVFYLQTQPPTRDGAYSSRGTLFVLRADGSTAHVADDIDQIQAVGSGAVPVLVRQPVSGADSQYAVLDPATLTITPLATTSTYTSFDFSPDAHWAAVMAATPGDGDVHPRWKLTMIDRRTGDTKSYPLDAQQGIVQPSWRPGHDEAWFHDGPHIFVWRAAPPRSPTCPSSRTRRPRRAPTPRARSRPMAPSASCTTPGISTRSWASSARSTWPRPTIRRLERTTHIESAAGSNPVGLQRSLRKRIRAAPPTAQT